MLVNFENSHLFPFDFLEAFYDVEIDSCNFHVKQDEHGQTGDK